MKSIPHYSKWLLLLTLTLFIFACSKNDGDDGPAQEANQETAEEPTDENENDSDNPGNTQNTVSIAELATSVEDLEALVAALIQADAGLVEALSEDGTFTVFAPTNAAFEAFLAQLDGFDSLDDFDTDEEKALLVTILTYHVISGQAAFSTDLSNGMELETLQTETVTVSIDGSVFIQDKTEDLAEVVGSDNEASNGVVHIINKVLLPQAVLDALSSGESSTDGTVVDVVVETEELSLLEAAVIKAGLVDALSADGPFTIFAPNNEAIQELFDLLGDSYNGFDDFTSSLEILLLQEILEYHVVPQNLLSTDLSPGTVASLDPDQTLEIIASGDSFVIGDASETDANLLEVDKTASNGVVHIVDKILISQEVADLLEDAGIDINDPPSGEAFTIKYLVENDEELEFLEEALRITGLLDTLGEDGPFTVFAPSSNTLSLLFGLLGNSISGIEDFDSEFEIDLLRDVLLYHVVLGNIQSSDLTMGEVTTLLGDTIKIAATEGEFVLQDATGLDANFSFTDIPASNGVIHVVNRILVPQSVLDTIVAETDENIQRLLELVEENEQLMMAILMAGEHLEEVLTHSPLFTFFLPTNQAFLDLFDQLDGVDSLADFDTHEELELLATILSYHLVLDVMALSTDLSDGQSLTTFQGETFSVSTTGGVFIVDKTSVPAEVTSPDNEVVNGVIHFIDKVLLPQKVLDSL